MPLSNIAFTYPYVLCLLILSPIIWKFLRSQSLSVELKKFPAISLIAKDKSIDNTFENNSMLIVVLRFLIFLLLVTVLSKPYYKNISNYNENKKVLIILDNSWEAGMGWGKKIENVKKLVTSKNSDNISYSLVTSSKINDKNFNFLNNKKSSEVFDFIESVKPNSWESDYPSLFQLINKDLKKYEDIYWFTEPSLNESKKSFFLKIKRQNLNIIKTPKNLMPPLFFLKENSKRGRYIFEIYDFNKFYNEVLIDCYDIKGRLITRKSIRGTSSKDKEWYVTEVTLEIPEEFDNSIAYFHLNNIKSSTAKVVKTNKSEQKRIGIIQPNYNKKISEFDRANFYINTALKENHNIIFGNVNELITQKISLLFSDDYDKSFVSDEKTIIHWIKNGGTFVKFGGPKLLDIMTKNNKEKLFETFTLSKTPINLNHELSFRKELNFKEFRSDSLFSGLKLSDDIKIKKYLEIKKNRAFKNIKHLAYLENGAPLISSFSLGKGNLIFFHLPVNANWSTFAFSILFVDILEKINLYSKGIKENAKIQSFKPFKILDGLGDFKEPNLNTMNFIEKDSKTEEFQIDYKNPPGIYKSKFGIYGLNISQKIKGENFNNSFTDNYSVKIFSKSLEQNLIKNIIFVILFLFLLETIILFNKRDILKIEFFKSSIKLFNLSLVIFIISSSTVFSENLSDKINSTRLAYVNTGSKEIDDITKKGMVSISEYISSKTSVILDYPEEINLDKDDIYFYPILYFPFINAEKEVSMKKIVKLQNFINNGGVIIFDCKNNEKNFFINDCLKDLLFTFRDLDISNPFRLRKKNIISRSFYLLNDFPGLRNQDVYVSLNNQTINDKVVSVIFGINDWAGSWAKSQEGSESPIISEKENQRKISFRFGVNLVIYSLTGNYKSDQVHIPEILKRMQ